MARSLPDESAVDDILEDLRFLVSVSRGLQKLDEGKSIYHAAVKVRLPKLD